MEVIAEEFNTVFTPSTSYVGPVLCGLGPGHGTVPAPVHTTQHKPR